MAKPIEIRTDFTGNLLRMLARSSRDAKQVRRLLAIASICDGGSRTDAAKIGGVGLQVLRDWIVRFNAEGPDGLIDRKAPGKPPALNNEQRLALAQAIETGANPYLGGLNRWRLTDLVQLLKDQFGVSVSETTVGRELRAMGYRKLPSSSGNHQGPGATGAPHAHGGGLWVKRPR